MFDIIVQFIRNIIVLVKKKKMHHIIIFKYYTPKYREICPK